MNIISRLWKALAALSVNLAALADTIGEANGQLRDRLGLDGAVRVRVLPAVGNKSADAAKPGKSAGKAKAKVGGSGPATIPLPDAQERRKQPTP